MYQLINILTLLGAINLVVGTPFPAAAKIDALEARGITYADGTKPSTKWTYPAGGLTIKTPAFLGGPELTFHGNDMDDAYSKLLVVNPAWNCTIVGGCPSGDKVAKRAHAKIQRTACGGYPATYYGSVTNIIRDLHDRGNMMVCAPAGPGKCSRVGCEGGSGVFAGARVGYCNDNTFSVCALATNMGDNVQAARSVCFQNNQYYSAQQFYANKRNIISRVA